MFPCGVDVCTSISKRCDAFWLRVGDVIPLECKHCTRVVQVPSECEPTYLQTVYKAACCGYLDEKHGVNLAALSETGLFQTHLAVTIFLLVKDNVGIRIWNGNIHRRGWRHCRSFMFKLLFQPRSGQQVGDLFKSAVKPECWRLERLQL